MISNPLSQLSLELQTMLRVNQAGEYGAVRIYTGQLAFLKDPQTRAIVDHMRQQEEKHLEGFNALLIEHHVAPTLLTPFWHVAGYAMGALSALISEKAAHACTIAVEEVIDTHYQGQIDALNSNDEQAQRLKDFFQQCQEEERDHKKIAEHEVGKDAPLYPVFTEMIKNASRLAIWLSKKL